MVIRENVLSFAVGHMTRLRQALLSHADWLTRFSPPRAKTTDIIVSKHPRFNLLLVAAATSDSVTR